MTTPDVDPFAEDPITRDQYGRPRIIPVKRGKPDLKAKLVGYTRVSTFADAIADAGGLATWRLWHLALGLGRNPDLAALAGTYGPTVDDLSRRDKAELSELIERAHDRSGGNVKADYGTAVHAYTEPGALDVPDAFDETERHSALLASIAADAAAFTAALDAHGLEVVETEQFVVNDDVQSAGTFDHTVRTARALQFDVPIASGVKSQHVPAGTVLVLDKKTGKLHFDTQAIQLALYANAKRYDPETGERADLGASFEWGVLAHVPKGEARCDLYLIDLRIGWAAAKLAGKVREHRTRKDIAVPFPAPEPTQPASDAIAAPTPVTYLDIASGEIRTGEPGEAVKLGVRVPVVVEDRPFDEADPSTWKPTAAELEAAPNGVDSDAAALATVTSIFPDAEPVRSVIEKLEAANSRDELSAVWREHKLDWTDEHTTVLRRRAAELEAQAA